MMSWASAYRAIGMTVASAGYLSTVQICVPVAVPVRLVFVTATRGSGTPLIVRLRKLGSTVDQLFGLIDANTQFSRRRLMASVDMLRAKPTGIFAASAA